MAIIAQFTTDPALITMMDKHHAWHTGGGAHGHPGRMFPMGALGSGREFFQFHRDLINEFFAWNVVHAAASASEIAAWSAVPAELKVPETGWPNPGFGSNLADAEARIDSNSPAFASEDELGIFVEDTIHNWIHGAVAASSLLALPAAERSVIAGFHSPQSTYFYKIHGLVQYWWDRWLHPKLHIKEVIDQKFAIKDLQDQKLHIKDIIDRHGKPHIKDIKEKDIKDMKEKDIFEGGKQLSESFDPRERLEHRILQSSLERLVKLEAAANRKRSPFIKPFMRPDVGHTIATAKPAKPRRKAR